MALIGLFVAAPAQADQYDFVSDLDNNGVYYSSISGVIDADKMTCRLLRSGAGVPALLPEQGGIRALWVTTIVVAAVDNMCPDANR